MMTNLIGPYFLLVGTVFLLSACSMAKLEARLEANPQCKDVVNPKTGTLMPCPGSEKSFYREVGLASARPALATNNTPASLAVAVGESSQAPASSNSTTTTTVSLARTAPAQSDCKPQIHKKTGGTLPCPAPE